MTSLQASLLIDGVVVVGVILAMGVRGQLKHSHPIVIYLIFHVFTFSARAWGLYRGARPFMNLSADEAQRALWMADVFLLSFAAAFLMLPKPQWLLQEGQARQLRPSVVWFVAAFTMPIGIYFLMTRTTGAGGGLSSVEYSTTYEIIATTWPVLILVALIYLYGFKWYYVLPLVLVLSRLALQGEGRSNLVLPCILLTQIYLDRRGMRFPTPRVVLALGALLLLFLPLDSLGTAYRTGTLDAGRVSDAVLQAFQDATAGDTSDQHVFDMFAITLTQSDTLGQPQYGRHFLNLLVLPIPRPWWPDKPATNEHLIAVSTPSRPLDDVGAVFTLPGEMYTDFRWVGVVIGAFTIGRILLFWYSRAYAAGYGTARHFFYLMVAAILIQTYRDGLSTFPIFLFVKHAPLIVMLLLVYMTTKPERLRPSGPAGAVAGKER